MAAEIQKNEVVAAKRQIDLEVSANGYGPAPRETDFIALGILFVPDASNVPHYKLGTGTCVNKRYPRVFSDDVVESVDTGADSLTLTGHGYEIGDGPFVADEDMGTVLTGSQFWIIVDDADTIGIAETLADAYAGTRVALAGTEAGATISDIDSAGVQLTQRGLDGKFTYTFTQTETNVSLDELTVLIEGTGFANAQGGGAYSTAALVNSGSVFDLVSGDGLTNQQKLNLAARFAGAKFTKVGNVYTWRDLADSKDSHTMTVEAGGRTVFTVIDLD